MLCKYYNITCTGISLIIKVSLYLCLWHSSLTTLDAYLYTWNHVWIVFRIHPLIMLIKLMLEATHGSPVYECWNSCHQKFGMLPKCIFRILPPENKITSVMIELVCALVCYSLAWWSMSSLRKVFSCVRIFHIAMNSSAELPDPQNVNTLFSCF